ncbi:T9SS type A sorting domain-containing protein [Flagellimonas olearia]|uniref:T9SS type A sorting domain-containing protein n=1 Tax=Flagellimonas olearia TaxID=552546 RepID=A0A6I1E625_9FLAO|nr:zinc-dependent metalloprotease family protein [Allomuricauda olearia]KAB7528996.1 T9SS type A sorting domain-containing protein [Allomuricauda olearia]
MKAKLHLVFSITIFFGSFCVFGQQGYWKPAQKETHLKSSSIKHVEKARAVFSLEESLFMEKLESSRTSKGKGLVVYFPNGDGEVVPFVLTETPVLHPELAKKYPNIRSFTGMSQDGKYKIKLSSSHNGLQTMMVNLNNHEKVFMEPISNKPNAYVLYNKGADAVGKNSFVCETEKIQQSLTAKTIVPLVDDQVLRKYRIAVSVTGEYTTYHGGTVADALAAINATLTRINEVFETDLGVTLELVPNNDLVIYTNPDTDPYNGNLNSQVQNTLTTNIGEANYDVGHLFHKVGSVSQNNGNAGFVGAVCVDNQKGSAFSAAFEPEGDIFDLDFVSHELGHQFGANHTWSFESEGTGVQAEPASGTTIMGYAGIVEGNNVAPNGDDYFHYNSILQISDYLQSTSCAQTTAIANSPPVLSPVNDFIIPIGTAFVLEGSATDPDLGDVLTYTWEQINNGVVTTNTFGPTNASGANFRSLPPSTDPERYFPRLSEVMQGNLTQTTPGESEAWETVSEIERTLTFACTVRDNALGGGQVVSDVLDVKVIKAAGPFVVTSQASSETYSAGSIQEVTWDVANTNILPIDAKTVDIFLSLDGGVTFPILLADDTLNDGAEDILLPGNAVSNARIMVKASDNIFFAVNATGFTIEASEVVLGFSELSYSVCQPNDIIIPFAYQTFLGFNETSTFSADVPVGITAIFSPTNASVDGTSVDLTLSNTGSVAPGVYDITVTSTSASVTKDVVLSLNVQDSGFAEVVLVSPGDMEANASLKTQLEWEIDPMYSNYDVEIATDVGFSNVIESASVPFNYYKATNLEEQTEYFWRVRPSNDCGTGTFGTPFSFTTIQLNCKNFESKNLPLEISNIGTPTITSSIQFLEDLPISDVNVNLELNHTYLEDLMITLISPQGTRVALISSTCGGLNNINAVFDDDGSEIVCGGNPAISGTVAPLGSLASLNGESILGEWVLEVKDNASSDGGALMAFSMEICVEGNFRPDDDEDGVFDDGDDLCLGTPKGIEVDTNGCAVYRFAQDNFEVQILSETCRDNNDGSIIIIPVDTAVAYSAVLNSGGTPLSVDFTNGHTFSNLNAGTYSLCISGTNGLITYREVCYDIVVSEPDILEVVALAEEGLVQLNMSGANLYNVELNGLVTQTRDSNIQLELKQGQNTLKVYTDLPCQGIFEQTYFNALQPILSPNPTRGITEVYLNGYIGVVSLKVFSSNGRLVKTYVKRLYGENLELDVSELSKGAYYLQVEKEGIKDTFKLIKK